MSFSKIIFWIFIILLGIILFTEYMTSSLSSEIDYNGLPTNDFSFEVSPSEISFNSTLLSLSAKEIVYETEGKIRLTTNGKTTFLNASIIKVQLDGYDAFFNDASFRVYGPSFVDLSCFNDNLFISPNTNQSYLATVTSNSNITILPYFVKSLSINDQEIHSFDSIEFKIISARANGDGLSVMATNPTKLFVSAPDFKLILFKGSDGVLRVDGRPYTITKNDAVLLMQNTTNGLFLLTDDKFEIMTSSYYALINDDNIMKPLLYYYFDRQIEKVNAFTAIILMIITGFYALDNHILVKENRKSQDSLHIQKRLELFYYPLLSAAEGIVTNKEYISGFLPISDEKTYNSCLLPLEKLQKLQYLASPQLKELYKSLMMKMYGYRDMGYSLNIATLELPTTDDTDIIEIRSEIIELTKNEILLLEKKLNEIHETPIPLNFVFKSKKIP